MKSTQERLSEVYCRPKTKEEWTQVASVKKLGRRFCNQQDAVSFWIDGDKGVVSDAVPFDRTEIPVSHFIDLLNDGIVQWRLEEDGFTETDLETCLGYDFALPNGVTIQVTQCLDVAVIEGDGLSRNVILFQGCKTYTDLLTLIRLIG
jgi:hypothetical protein